MGLETSLIFRGGSGKSIGRETSSGQPAGSNNDTQKLSPEQRRYTRAREHIRSLYEIRDPHRRSEELMKHLEPLFRHCLMDCAVSEQEIAAIREKILRCEDIRSAEQFADYVMLALQPIFGIAFSVLEEIQTKVMNEQGGFTEINRLFSYGKSGSTIHIHASFGESVEKKISLYRDGMRRLAQIVNGDPDIEEITATSWIVARHPRMFEGWGFTIEDVSASFRKQHFGRDTREVKRATIRRDEFLRRFLKKEE
jgi:hypothetical protein